MNRQGAGVSQIFVYIITLVTFALIMIFGIKAILGFIQDAQKIEFIQFKSDLENSVEQLRSEFGAVRKEEFLAPGIFHQICFIDLDYVPSPEEAAALCQLNQIACQVWKESSGFETEEENVFLTPPAEARLKVSKISLEQGFLCVPIRQGKFSLILEGQGDGTKVRGLS